MNVKLKILDDENIFERRKVWLTLNDFEAIKILDPENDFVKGIKPEKLNSWLGNKYLDDENSSALFCSCDSENLFEAIDWTEKANIELGLNTLEDENNSELIISSSALRIQKLKEFTLFISIIILFSLPKLILCIIILFWGFFAVKRLNYIYIFLKGNWFIDCSDELFSSYFNNFSMFKMDETEEYF
jgi:hypothetical protein